MLLSFEADKELKIIKVFKGGKRNFHSDALKLFHSSANDIKIYKQKFNCWNL